MSSFILNNLKISGCANTCGDDKILNFYVFVNATYESIGETSKKLLDILLREFPSYLHSNISVSTPEKPQSVTSVSGNHIHSWSNMYDNSTLMIDVEITFPDQHTLNKFKLTHPEIYQKWREYL